jgi:hypothetical protein
MSKTYCWLCLYDYLMLTLYSHTFCLQYSALHWTYQQAFFFVIYYTENMKLRLQDTAEWCRASNLYLSTLSAVQGILQSSSCWIFCNACVSVPLMFLHSHQCICSVECPVHGPKCFLNIQKTFLMLCGLGKSHAMFMEVNPLCSFLNLLKA